MNFTVGQTRFRGIFFLLCFFFYFYIAFIEILKFKFKLSVFSAGFSAVDEERTPKTARSFEIKECFCPFSKRKIFIYGFLSISNFVSFRSLCAGTGVSYRLV